MVKKETGGFADLAKKQLFTLSPFSITLIYIVAGVLWIAFSDSFLDSFTDDTAILSTYQTYKGWGYVFVTGLFLYWLISIMQREREIARKDLQRKEKTYRDLFFNNPIPVFLYDPETLAIIEANKATLQTYGYSRAEIHSMKLSDLCSVSDLEKLIKNIQQKKGTLTQLKGSKHLKKNGDRIIVDIYSQPFLYNEKSVEFTLAQDVTKQVFYENEIIALNENLEKIVEHRTLELQNVNEELEAFSYSVSHDLRSPLRAVNGFTEAYIEENNDSISEEGMKYLQRVKNAAIRMNELIDSYLKLSKLIRTELKFEKVNISEMASGIMNNLCNENPERDIIFESDEDIIILADKNLIHNALENLLSNAVKFTSKEKTAKIKLEKKSDSGFSVSDNGVGFDMKYKDKLFKPFQRLHSDDEFKGTGIGLASVKRIINRHGGAIAAEAKKEKGTKFVVELKQIS